MNKKQIIDMIDESINFDIYLKDGYQMKDLNKDKISFVNDKLMKITIAYKIYTYFDVASISHIVVME